MMFHYIYSFVIFSSTAIKDSTSSDNLTHKKNGLEPSASCWDSSSLRVFFIGLLSTLFVVATIQYWNQWELLNRKTQQRNQDSPISNPRRMLRSPLLQLIRKKRVRRTDVENWAIVTSLSLAERGPVKLEVWNVTGMLCTVWSRVLLCQNIGQAS